MMNLHEMTAEVLRSLADDEFDEILIFDHGSDDPASIRWLASVERRPGICVVRREAIPDESLYRAWNDTIRRALMRYQNRTADVVLFNNDIHLPPGFTRFLTRALRAGPPSVVAAFPDVHADMHDGIPTDIKLTPTGGVAADGGLTGWAFALKAEMFATQLPLIDERLRFYSGDRDLIFNIQLRGFVAARVDGLPCRHGLGVTRKKRPELAEQMRRDVELCWRKWQPQMQRADLSERERRILAEH